MKEYIDKIKRVNPIVLLLVGTFLIISLLRATKDEPVMLVIEEKSWPVSVIEAQYDDVQPTLALFGEVITSRRSELRALVGGQVVEVGENFKEGAVVGKGELLLKIDDFEYRNSVTEETAKLEVMNRDFERADELFKQGSISEQFRDNALLEKTQQELVLSEAEKDLRDTELFAPFDGVINDVQATLGKQVSTFNDKIGEIIELGNDQETPLRPGAFVRLRMPDKTYESVISIPETAVYQDEYIYIVKDQRLKKAVIVISGYDQSNVLIQPIDELMIENGDLIVTNQLREAGEGVKVDIL